MGFKKNSTIQNTGMSFRKSHLSFVHILKLLLDNTNNSSPTGHRIVFLNQFLDVLVSQIEIGFVEQEKLVVPK